MIDRIDGLRGAPPAARPGSPAPAGGQRFAEALAAMERSPLEFSKHMVRRVEQRGLRLDDERVSRLEQAVSRAEEKGSRDSLILLDELAVVVSVRNHTVITAVDEASRKEQVFTNIDSVVIAEPARNGQQERDIERS